MTTKYKTTTFLFLMCMVVLAGCAMAGNPVYAEPSPAGFWQGLWHGMISVIALIWHLFDPTVRVYEVANSGGWYDFGFLIGAGGSSCSCAEGGRRRVGGS